MYLTLLVVTRPVLASNARGEGNGGNGQNLQKISTPDGVRTVINGFSIRYSIRAAMLAEGAAMWRQHDANPETKAHSGYTYGPENKQAMKDALPENYTDYDDTLAFGFMVAESGNTERASKKRGALQVSPAVSTTPYSGDTGFTRGLNATKDQLQPFTYERHYTRYQYTVTANLRDFAKRPQALQNILNALASLQVGGSHSANASSLIPEMLVWRFHKTPGQGGLYFAGGIDYAVEDAPTLDLIRQRCQDLGITFSAAGVAVSDRTIADGLSSILEDAQMEMEKLGKKS